MVAKKTSNDELIKKKCLLLHSEKITNVRKIVTNILLVINRLRYGIVFAIGIVLVVFVDEYSVLRFVELRSEISDMKEELEKYRTQYERDTKQLRELRRNRRAAEKVARELYFMKHDDEDVFVLSDDPREPTNPIRNEAIE